MSHIDEIITARLGEATAGPIQQDGAARRAAICFGYLADRPDRRTVWLESRAELLALYNAAGHQLARWDALDRQLAEDTHPSQPNLAPAPQPSQASAPEPAPTFTPAPVLAPVVRGPFESAQPLPAVASAAPVPPSAAAMSAAAMAEPETHRGARPYVLQTPGVPEAGEAVVPDPPRRPVQQ